MPATHVATTVQIFIVVVMPDTHVYYDCTEIYRRSQRGYRCSYDCTEIYRRSLTGNVSYYDCSEIYRRSHAGYACTYDSGKYLS